MGRGVCDSRILGMRGSRGRTIIEAPGYPVQVLGSVAVGYAFAAAFLHGLGKGWPTPEIADFANRVGALVASRRGAIPDWTIAEADALGTKLGRLETA